MSDEQLGYTFPFLYGSTYYILLEHDCHSDIVSDADILKIYIDYALSIRDKEMFDRLIKQLEEVAT